VASRARLDGVRELLERRPHDEARERVRHDARKDADGQRGQRLFEEAEEEDDAPTLPIADTEAKGEEEEDSI
jgi:hypothetical protein